MGAPARWARSASGPSGSRRGVPPSGGIAWAQRVASRGLPRRADGQHLAVGGPADQLRGGVAPPREPTGGAAVDRRDEHLRRPLARRRPRHRRAVGRDPGPGHRHAVGREPVGAAAADRRGPHVVFRDEDERVAVQMGVAEVAGGHGETVARSPDRPAARRRWFSDERDFSSRRSPRLSGARGRCRRPPHRSRHPRARLLGRRGRVGRRVGHRPHRQPPTRQPHSAAPRTPGTHPAGAPHSRQRLHSRQRPRPGSAPDPAASPGATARPAPPVRHRRSGTAP